MKLFNDRVLKPRDEENAAAAAAAAGEKSSSSSKSSKGIIIVVPTALTSTITMYNAKEFLESGNLTQGEQLPGKKPKFDIIIRKSSSSVHSQTYKLIDDPIKLTNEEWERVGAVFVTGQLWQFKDWKYTEPAELFHHVLGIHLMYDDRHPPTTIQSWNCKLLKVKPFPYFRFCSRYLIFFLVAGQSIQATCECWSSSRILDVNGRFYSIEETAFDRIIIDLFPTFFIFISE